MLNHIWLAMLLTAMLVAGITGNVRASVDAAIRAAELAPISISALMDLWSRDLTAARKLAMWRAVVSAPPRSRFFSMTTARSSPL